MMVRNFSELEQLFMDVFCVDTVARLASKKKKTEEISLSSKKTPCLINFLVVSLILIIIMHKDFNFILVVWCLYIFSSASNFPPMICTMGTRPNAWHFMAVYVNVNANENPFSRMQNNIIGSKRFRFSRHIDLFWRLLRIIFHRALWFLFLSLYSAKNNWGTVLSGISMMPKYRNEHQKNAKF